VEFTNPMFEYSGFVINAPAEQYSFSWMLLGLFSILLLPYLKKEDNFSTYFVILVFFYRLVPVTTIMGFVEQSHYMMLNQIAYWLFFLIIPHFINLKVNFYEGDRKSIMNNDKILYFVLGLFGGVVFFISAFYAKFRINLGLDNIYDLREEARTFDMPAPLLYLWAAAKNILPVFFVFFLLKRNRTICILLAFLILLDFSIDGLKAKIAYLFLCVFLHFFYSQNIRYYVGFIFMGLAFVGLLESIVFDTQFLHFLITRRVLFEPGLLDTYYFDYISEYGPLYYARETLPIQRVIGDLYFDSPDMNSNNGLFSDAYMNLGGFGCIVYPIILTVIVKFCDNLFKYANKELVFFACIVMTVTVGSAELTTSLLTHGLFFLFLILYLISESNYRNSTCTVEKVTAD
jgi:hypothetical protein